MRPVDKGIGSDIQFGSYGDAEPYLEERLGAYCSYCEFPIKHAPEVEHKEAKSTGGSELAWENLLLSCKYCNTRKGIRVKLGDKDKYLWPDEDDTFHVFSYINAIPVLNETYLQDQPPEITEKAKRLLELIKLNNVPVIPEDKDRRYRCRNEALNCALESKNGWNKVKNSEHKEEYLRNIKVMAVAIGFFSTWMMVFQDEPEIKQMLVEAFPGTKTEWCDI